MPRLSSTTFADLSLVPAVLEALTRKSYDRPTPVQEAVRDPALAGRDLLVSSQTGSGKTVAFGTLIADALRPSGGVPGATRTQALVVAPTRELAAQVARELGWLLERAGAAPASRLVIAPFTGGTSVADDLRRLRRGVDVVVGTPGRLVDLHERGALDLSGLAILVLDEADEMLDLGFKEDLEYLLGHAAPARRTLLFSATLPPDIRKLASRFQRDAASVDVRPGGASAGHADIRHVAHLVRPQDRLAAVVNVLGAAGDAKAIVFCRTRESVGDLHQRLSDLGFRAAAIAGDRAQGDRDRALESLRTGNARVLVATNVAARGIDLPDVELVLHADLPESGESLTHRSGRTGRAGRKGTSVVIADLRERRKAERLLAAAAVEARWTPAPSEADVKRATVDRLTATLLAETTSRAESAPGLEALVDRLRAAVPERALLGALLERELLRQPPALPIEPVSLAQETRRDRRTGRDGGPAPAEVARAWTKAVIFRVNLGADKKADPASLLPLICRRGGINRHQVGVIRVAARGATFEIAADAAEDFARAAAAPDPRAPEVVIQPLFDGPADGPAHRPRQTPGGGRGRPGRPVVARPGGPARGPRPKPRR